MASVFSRRIIAYILDFFVVSSIMWIVCAILPMFMNPYKLIILYPEFVYAVPILIMVYFTICEGLKGASIGKAVMYLEVRDIEGYRITWIQAFVRNLTKIFWFPIIFDWAIGHILGKRDRIFDTFTKTIVINTPTNKPPLG